MCEKIQDDDDDTELHANLDETTTGGVERGYQSKQTHARRQRHAKRSSFSHDAGQTSTKCESKKRKEQARKHHRRMRMRTKTKEI